MKKHILLTLCILGTLWCYAQEMVEGYVFDSSSQKPLMGATVYFDGSTIGAMSDENGYFSIETEQKLSAPLVISFMGYQSFAISDPYGSDLSKIYLTPVSIQLREVVVTVKDDPFTREQKLRVFRIEFLGKTKMGRSCRILNEDAINIYFDVTDNTLKAYSYDPIIIQNDYLKYKLTFNLDNFEIPFKTKSLDPIDMGDVYYIGTCFYEDTSEGSQQAINNRENAYLGSTLHFMRATANQVWKEEGFRFFLEKGWKKRIKPEKYITVTDEGDRKRVEITEKITFSLKKKKYSKILADDSIFYIDQYGNHSPIKKVRLYGWARNQRIGGQLPSDFEYNPDRDL
ncbi:carboxypeptidase-like regulatory domain-containing protein [Ascidiimonas aurantiaca]|uniref:carboxypeptidase-like regulatory domain-containing protein n=1 Tax=Ascidiimonas aurantiaca TaxID=1685432 RepID=UPI0030EB9BE4